MEDQYIPETEAEIRAWRECMREFFDGDEPEISPPQGA